MIKNNIQNILIPIFLFFFTNIIYSQDVNNSNNIEYTKLNVTFYYGFLPLEYVIVELIDPYGNEKTVTSGYLIGRNSFDDYSDFTYQIEKDYESQIRVELPKRGISITQGLKYSKPIYLEISVTLKNEIIISTSDSPFIRE